MRIQFRSVQSRLLFSICAMVAAAVIILQGITLIIVRRSFNQLVPEKLHATLQTTHTLLHTQMQSHLSILEGQALIPQVRNAALPLAERAKALQEFIEAQADGDHPYLSCIIADVEGNASYSTGQQANISNQPYFQRALTEKTTITEPFYCPVTGQLTVVYAVPLHDAIGRNIGALALNTDALHLSKYLLEADLGETGTAWVMDREGDTVASNIPQEVYDLWNDIEAAKYDSDYEDIVDAMLHMLDGNTGSARYRYLGERETMYYMPVQGTDWALGVAQTDREAYALFYHILYVGLVVLSAALVVCGLLAALLARGFAVPLVQLAAAARDLGAGDGRKAALLQTGSQDEVGALVSAFSEMSDSIRYQAGVLSEVAAGDLSVQVLPKGENDTLSLALRDMVERNSKLVGDIKRAVEQVNTSADHIASGSEYLAESCVKQTMAGVQVGQETSSIHEQISSSLERAEQAQEYTRQAEEQLYHAAGDMESMTTAMGEILEASNNIQTVVTLIEDIAFQTELLSLNAAVEAARAGVHGKGFGVVVDEVRRLALQSARAAQQTADLVENSLSKVEDGSRIAAQTGGSIQQVIEYSHKVVDSVNKNAAANRRQVESIAKINGDIEEMNDATQANSALAQEMAGSAQELQQLARELDAFTARYRLAGSDTFAGEHPEPPPKPQTRFQAQAVR